MTRRGDVYVSVIDRPREAIEKLFELAEGDHRCIGTIVGKGYARIWWMSYRLEWRVGQITKSELNQISRLHDSATESVPLL